MKRLSSVVVSLLVLIILIILPSRPISSAHSFEDCSCSAPDGSCSASISCPRGCIQHCVGQGDCYAECSGFYELFSTETTVQLQNATYPQLVGVLARVSGKDVAFFPNNPSALFNADYKKALLWDVLDMLSDRGTVQIAGKDFEKLKRLRKALLSGTRISLCVGRTPVSTFVNDTSSLTGIPLRITSGSPLATVNLKLQDVTLDDILTKVSEQSGTKIVEDSIAYKNSHSSNPRTQYPLEEN